MAMIFEKESRTFSEYLLVPNLTTRSCTPDQVRLSTSIVRYRKGNEPSPININVPLVSAVMQAVSDDRMAMRFARKVGGLSLSIGSRNRIVTDRAGNVREKVKKYKLGLCNK